MVNLIIIIMIIKVIIVNPVKSAIFKILYLF